MRRLCGALLFLVTSILLCACSSFDAPATNSEKSILVTGATGTQGGAVARELLARGYRVRALTRRPDSERALALAELGAEPIKGDFDNPASLRRAMSGVHGVFAVTDFWEHGFDREIAHGKQLVNAAVKSGVQHFVFTSVAGANQAPNLAHFDSKARIEAYLMNSKLAYTILRPVEFLDNISYMRSEIESGIFADPRSIDSSHQWIAARDIGFFAGEAFDHPDTWLGVTQDIAGIDMTLEQFVATLTRVTGFDLRYVQTDWGEFEAANGPEMTEMLHWFDETGYSADVEGLRARYPGLTTVEEYLFLAGWNAGD